MATETRDAVRRSVAGSVAAVGRTQMIAEGKTLQILEKALATVDDHGTKGARLLDDAGRLWDRVRSLLAMKLIVGEVDREALHVACYALQLPLRQTAKNGKAQRSTPRDRAEQAGEMLAALVSAGVPERTYQILRELTLRSPVADEARLLSDAMNLDDFGVTALLIQASQLSRTGGGISQVLDGLEKREQYGYWDARLKDGFHFEPVRKIARQRLENTRRAAALLRAEMGEDRGA